MDEHASLNVADGDLQHNGILIVSDFYRGSTSWELAEGLGCLGWDVHIIDLKSYVTEWRNPILRGLRRTLTSAITRDLHDHMLELQSRAQLGYVLNLRGAYFDRKLMVRLKEQGAKVAMFYPDFSFNRVGVHQDTFPLYDGIATTKSFQMDYLLQSAPRAQLRYIPHGYSDTVHRPLKSSYEESEYETDIGYVGNYSEFKEGWLRAIAVGLPELKLRVIGNGWVERCSSEQLRKCIVGPAVLGRAFCHAIQSARINIAVHFGPERGRWQDLTSTRTFEIPACKGFMLHIDNQEVRDLFEVGQEIDVFSTPEGLLDKIKAYLPAACKRRDMIEAAHQRAVPAYGLRRRAGELDDFLKSL